MIKMSEKIVAKGKPASPGVAAGIVRVVIRTEELPKVQRGDILVIKASNPAWTIGMVKAAALICEVGGIISHVAIVAREMGIPCVVSVENATSIFRDNERVKVDGDEGVIYELR